MIGLSTGGPFVIGGNWGLLASTDGCLSLIGVVCAGSLPCAWQGKRKEAGNGGGGGGGFNCGTKQFWSDYY